MATLQMKSNRYRGLGLKKREAMAHADKLLDSARYLAKTGHRGLSNG
jgi:hypothetical protein